MYVLFFILLILDLHVYCRYVSAKEVDPSTLEKAQVMALKFVCLLEKTFPRSIITSRTQLIIRLIKGISLCGLLSTPWMFFLQCFLETLNDFLLENAPPKGNISEVLLIWEGLVYISQYLDRFNPELYRSFCIGHFLKRLVLPQGKSVKYDHGYKTT